MKYYNIWSLSSRKRVESYRIMTANKFYRSEGDKGKLWIQMK